MVFLYPCLKSPKIDFFIAVKISDPLHKFCLTGSADLLTNPAGEHHIVPVNHLHVMQVYYTGFVA